jgi:hypothetical protein
MTIRARCPQCQALFQLPADSVGKPARCQRCSKVFEIVPEKPEEALEVVPPEDVPEPRRTSPPRQPRARSLPKTVDHLEEVEPLAPRPAPARTSPRSAPRSGSGILLPLLLIGGFFFVLLASAAGIGLAYYFDAFTSSPPVAEGPKATETRPPELKVVEPKEPVNPAPEPKEPVNPAPEPKEPVNPAPEPKEPVNPAPEPKEPVNPAPEPREPAPAGPVELKPTRLATSREEKPLPGTVSDLAVGGGGRYLILHLGKLRKLAIFDIQELQTHYIPAASDTLYFTAGRDKLVIVLPDQNIIQRWDLQTRTREVATTLPFTDTVRGVLMGSASEGPVLVGGKSTHFLDLRTLRPVDIKGAGALQFGDGSFTRRIWVSADGTVFGSTYRGLSPSGLNICVLQGNECKNYSQHISPGHILPGPNGKVIYTSGGRYTPQARKLDGDKQSLPCYPSLHPNYYFSIRFGDRLSGGFPSSRQKKAVMSVHLAGDSRPLLTLPEVELPVPRDRFGGWGSLGLDKRIHLIPQAKVLVIIPLTDDRIVLHRFDVEEALEKAGIDYLLVSSTPPGRAYKGKPFAYQVKVKSKKGGVKYTLASGPEGMKVTSTGLLSWQVPADLAGSKVNVILSISDKTGQEIFHTFDLAIAEGGAAPGPIVKLPKEPEPPVEPEPKQPVEPEPKEAAEPKQPAPAVATNITPPKLDQPRVERPLPATIADVVVGGRGRYLILSLPRLHKLGIFDANEGKVVKYLPLAQDSPRIAAGLHKLFVAYPEKNILQRYDLNTFEREVTTTLPLTGPVGGLCMGSASTGPLFVFAQGDRIRTGGGVLLDPHTLQPLKLEGMFPGVHPPLARVSADGKLLGARPDVGGEPHDVVTVALTETRLRTHKAWLSASLLVPGPRGKFVYTAGGVFSPELKPIFPRTAEKSQALNKPFLPAEHGSFFMQLDPGSGDGSGSLSFFLPGQTRPIVRLDQLEGIRAEGISYGSSRDPLHHDKRVHFIPEAKLLVTIPQTNDRLVLRRFDVLEALEKSDIDYLVVVSEPPERATKNTRFRYPLVVKSKKGGVKYTLASGPEGMAIAKDGLLTWKVPAAPAGESVDVIVSISDQTGQEIFHTFTLSLDEAKEPDKVVKLPPMPANPPVEPEPKEPKEPEEPEPEEPSAEANPTAIPVANLENDRVERMLPGSVEALAVGGAGRYLVLNLPKQRKLAIFDVSEAKVIHYLPLAEDDVCFTAGLTKLFVILPNSRILQRWDLATGKREKILPLRNVSGTVSGVFMGSASHGPLLLVMEGAGRSRRSGAALLLDPRNLLPLTIRSEGGAPIESFAEPKVRVSADGLVFGTWRPGISPQGIRVTVLEGKTAKVSYEHTSAGHVIPGPRGRVIYTAKGRYTSQVKPLDADRSSEMYCLPAHHPNYYLSINVGRGIRAAKPVLSVHLAGDSSPLITLPEVELPEGINPWDREEIGTDQRIHLVPDAKVIAILPSTNDRIVLYRFDIEKALEKAGIDYLLVLSTPPGSVRRGQKYEYQMVVKSKKGGVKYKLDSGPEGMTLSDTGMLTWNAPRFARTGKQDVIISIRDAAGQERFQTFSISIR